MDKQPLRDERGRVLPGQSLNTQGKPKGSLGQSGKLREALKNELPAILEALISKAKEGDTQACRIILDRVLPPLRAEAALVHLPSISSTNGLTSKAKAIIDAVAKGELATNIAAELLSAMGGFAKLKETDELEGRIRALEGKK